MPIEGELTLGRLILVIFGIFNGVLAVFACRDGDSIALVLMIAGVGSFISGIVGAPRAIGRFTRIMMRRHRSDEPGDRDGLS